MGVAVSASHIVSAAPFSSSWGGLLTLFPCSSVGSLPQETVLHELLQHESSPSHGLQFFTNSCSVGPFHRVQSFRNRQLQRGSPTGSQVLSPNLLQRGLLSLQKSTGPARSLLQCGLPTGSQPPSGIHLLQRGVLHGLQVDICSTVDLHGLQGDSLPHHGLPHGLQGNLCSSTWSTSSPSFFPDLGVCRVFPLAYSHSSLPGAVAQCFLPFLKYVVTEALPMGLIGPALASGGSVLEPAETGSV